MDATEFIQAITSIATTISTVVTESLDWVSMWVTRITGSPLLLIMVVAVPLVGLGVGLLRRLINVN